MNVFSPPIVAASVKAPEPVTSPVCVAFGEEFVIVIVLLADAFAVNVGVADKDIPVEAAIVNVALFTAVGVDHEGVLPFVDRTCPFDPILNVCHP